MENEGKRFESVYSTKVRAGRRRTYFFDVRQTKGEDYYITLTESTRKFNGDGYERHKIFLYKEDFNRFLASLEDAVSHVKTELMPEYDYDEYTKRQEEWEAEQKLIAANGTMAKEAGSQGQEKVAEKVTEPTDVVEAADSAVADEVSEVVEDVADVAKESTSDSSESDSEEDMSW